MATDALGEERPTLFLRKATGLVRGWSVRDSMIYACLSTNVITLGLVEFAYQDAFPTGQLLTAVLISGRLGVVPRPRLQRARRHDPPGGRRLRLAVPHPGQRARLRDGRHRLVVHPVAVGADLRVGALRGVLPAAVGGVQRPVGRGLVRHAHRHVRRHADHDRAWPASSSRSACPGTRRVQKWCFYGGLLGFAIIVILLLAFSRNDFISAFNNETREAVRHEERVRGHHRGRRIQGDRVHAARRSASPARSASRCCWCRC